MVLTATEKQKIINQYITSSAGRRKLATSMQQPLRQRRDYSAVGRRAFYVEELPNAALPIYDKDPEVKAYVVSEEGENILCTSRGSRVWFPLFEIASNPEIPITQIKERRFDLVERTVNLGKAQVQAAEDSRLFDIVDAVAESSTNPNKEFLVTGPLVPSTFADAFAQIEHWDLRVAFIFMNALDFADLRKWGRDVFDLQSQANMLHTGLMADLYGAKIIISRIVDEGTVYVCGEPEFLGRIPVRTEISCLSADDPKTRRIGFSIFENIGIGAYNPLAIVKIKIAR